MKYIRCSLLTLCVHVVFSSAFAGTQGEVTSPNQTGLYLGIGGSYNYGLLDTSSVALLNASSGFPPLGVFTGYRNFNNNTAQAFSPEAQLGYFQNLHGSEWLWGLEFLYQYSNLNFDADVSGAYVTVANPLIGVGNAITAGRVRTNVNDTLMLPVFIGHNYNNGFVYLGLGPSLFYLTEEYNNLNDAPSARYIGNINNFSKSEWIWGGAVQAGVSYYVNPTWFLKLNYTCAFTGNYTINNLIPFSQGVNNGLNSGTLTFNNQENLVTQQVALSINKVFSL